jgi:hypothetical protein
VFGCEVEAAPQPTVAWFRGDAPLAPNDRIKFGFEPVAGVANRYAVSMVVQGVSAADSGQYKVQVANAHGQMAANVNLNLQPPAPQGGKAPVFQQKPAIKQLDGGKKVLFECKIAADPKPLLTWFRDVVQLSDGGRYRYIETEESPGVYYVGLELSNPQAVDAATYKLNAKNQYGESNANLKLNFDAPKPPAAAPSFTANPSIQQTNDGGVVFEVRLSSYPAPTVQWFKGNSVLSDGGRYRSVMQTDGLNYVLIMYISGITKEDSGAYKVTAKNAAGESNANINLNLEGDKEQKIEESGKKRG